MKTVSVLAAVLVLATILVAQGQPQGMGQSSAKPIEHGEAAARQTPEWLMYRLYFKDVEMFDQAAAAMEAKGDDGSGWRTYAQFKAGLTSDEAAILKQVAFECNRAAEDNNLKVQAIQKNLRAQLPQAGGPPAPPAPPSQELMDAFEQEKRITESCVDQLRAKLGERTFEQLSGYVHHKFEKHAIIEPQLKPKNSTPPNQGEVAPGRPDGGVR